MSKTKIQEPVDIILKAISDEFYKDDNINSVSEREFKSRFNDIKSNRGNERFHSVFENIEKKRLNFIYYGTIMNEYYWIYLMEIDDEDLDFHMIRHEYPG
jgi:hypothetical protein